MYAIGKFSMISRLSVKTLRHYHEIGLLIPDHVDEENGYRYYKPAAADRAWVITHLREMEFPLKDIQEILRDCREDTDLVRFLQERRRAIQEKIKEYRSADKSLENLIHNIETGASVSAPEGVTETKLDDFLFCGIRRTGRWDEIGPSFGLVARKAGRRITGPAMSLCHDGEYRESDANYEAGFPVNREIHIKPDSELTCRLLPGGPHIRFSHVGPYSELGRGYAIALRYLEEQGYEMSGPTRESYIKGPGMILRGNPRKYVTEIQIPIA